jgi:hypothetical protein
MKTIKNLGSSIKKIGNIKKTVKNIKNGYFNYSITWPPKAL